MDVERLLTKATDELSVRRAFGPPIERDGTLIIPVACVVGGGGGGAGGPEHDDTAGVGGGFGGLAWPLGVYVVKEGRVRWAPAVDATRIALAALGIVRAVLKLRGFRRMKSGS